MVPIDGHCPNQSTTYSIHWIAQWYRLKIGATKLNWQQCLRASYRASNERINNVWRNHSCGWWSMIDEMKRTRRSVSSELIWLIGKQQAAVSCNFVSRWNHMQSSFERYLLSSFAFFYSVCDALSVFDSLCMRQRWIEAKRDLGERKGQREREREKKYRWIL